MIKKHDYDCIILNGDSYSAISQCIVPYGNLLGQPTNIPVYNIAIAGSNNDRIFRSSVEKIFLIKETYKNPLVIIGWSFVRRLEVWYYGKNKTLIESLPDIDKQDIENSLRFVTLDKLINAKETTLEQKSLLNEDAFLHKQLMNFYTNVFSLATFLDFNNLNYFFFSAAKNTECPIDCFPALNNLNIIKSVLSNQRIFNLHEFCIMDWALANDPQCNKTTGHLSQNGHIAFSKYLQDILKLK